MILNTGFAKNWLESTIEWLQSCEDSDLQWTVQTEHLQECLREMRSAQPLPPDYIGHKPGSNPAAELFTPVMPRVEALIAAMRQRDRKKALEIATAAVACL